MAAGKCSCKYPKYTENSLGAGKLSITLNVKKRSSSVMRLVIGKKFTLLARVWQNISMRITPLRTVQSMTITTPSAQSSAISAGNKIVRLVSTIDSYIAIGSNPTATSASLYLVAGVPEFFAVTAGEKIAALRVGGSDGVLSIAEGIV